MTVPSQAGWTLTITLESPFALSGGSPDQPGLDHVINRRRINQKDHAVVSGTLLRGILRDSAQSLAAACAPSVFGQDAVDWLFGTPSQPPGVPTDTGLAAREEGALKNSTMHGWAQNMLPLPSALVVDDLISDQPLPDTSGIYHRVSLDPDLGSAREGHLQMIELPWPVGTAVSFSGSLRLGPSAASSSGSATSSPAERAEKLLRQAVTLLTRYAIGGFRSAGFGRVLEAKLTPLPSPPTIAVSVPSLSLEPGRRTLLRVRADRPMVVSTQRASDNHGVSAATLSGAVLKGALAAMLGQTLKEDAIAQALSALRFGEAQPVPAGQGLTNTVARSAVLPRSWIRTVTADGTARYVNLAFVPASTLPPDEIPAGPFDFKSADYAALSAGLGLSATSPARTTATRTAMDYQRGAGRFDPDSNAGAVFAYTAVCPHDEGGSPIDWELAIDVPDGIDAQALNRISVALRRGWDRVGKTGARLTLTAARTVGSPQISDAVLLDRPDDGQGAAAVKAAIMLQTPAALLDPARKAQATDLNTRYQDYFAAQGCTLEATFAAHQLAGGYQALRYSPSPDGYCPWILTSPGSVFVLGFPDRDSARTALTRWQAAGLPPPDWLDGRSWRTNPFVTENGFAAIQCLDPAQTEIAAPAPSSRPGQTPYALDFGILAERV